MDEDWKRNISTKTICWHFGDYFARPFGRNRKIKDFGALAGFRITNDKTMVLTKIWTKRIERKVLYKCPGNK